MSKSVHYCENCGSQDVEVMVWAMWDIQGQTWEFTSDDGEGPTYCNACELHDVRVVHGTKERADDVARAYAGHGEDGDEE